VARRWKTRGLRCTYQNDSGDPIFTTIANHAAATRNLRRNQKGSRNDLPRQERINRTPSTPWNNFQEKNGENKRKKHRHKICENAILSKVAKISNIARISDLEKMSNKNQSSLGFQTFPSKD